MRLHILIILIIMYWNVNAQDQKKYFGILMNSHPYIMSEPLFGNRTDLHKKDRVQLLGVEDIKIKIYVEELKMYGYVWADDIEMNNEYIEFINQYPLFLSSNATLKNRIQKFESTGELQTGKGYKEKRVTYSIENRIGFGIAYATSNSIDMEFFFIKNNNFWKFGYSQQLAGTRGKLVVNRLPNYGLTKDGGGEYFYSFDLGYGRVFNDVINFDIEVSVGSNNEFTNYIDRRFRGDGFHMIDNSELVAGIGINAGFNIGEHTIFYTGYNSLRKLQFGFRFAF